MEIIEIILRHWAWPIFLFVIIMIFRKQISEFLQRLKTLKISGTVLETRIPAEQKTIEIKKSLLKSKEEIKKSVKEKNSTTESLVRKYYKLLKKYKYEKILNSIYGTQLDLLKHLSRRGTVGDKYINLRNFYDGYCRQLQMISSTAPPPMIKYLEFLENSELIKYVGEGDERIVKITPLGNGFLSYIKDQYPAEIKPYRYL